MLERSMASLLTAAKGLCIATGLYRPARRLSRSLRRAELREFQEDIVLYRSLLAPGALCFDIGANIGAKSEALLHAGARVVAFEPNPLVVPELRARCAYHAKWTLVQAALGSGVGVATLYARQLHGQSGLKRDWEGEVTAEYSVPVVTLDAAIRCFGAPAYCKIDVEGWELEVLKGLTQPVPLVSFEFHISEQEVEKAKSCLDWLARFGPSQVNVTPSETAVFQLREWMPLQNFVDWFPGDLGRSVPGLWYGNIFVRSVDNDHRRGVPS